MTYLPLRSLPARPARPLSDRWLGALAERLHAPDEQTPEARALLCRDTLAQLLYPTYVTDLEDALADEALPVGTRLALASLDPRNVTLEPEYYAECDDARFQPVKPLLWLWYSFDRSPLGGQSVELGVRLRRLLAPLVFRSCGENFKCFQHVEFSFGYNMEVGNDVVIHRHVLLDDRGGIVLGDHVSVSDYANVYSHQHNIVEQADVTARRTVLHDGVRITYHATILAGVDVGEQGMVGACALATHDVPPYNVSVGVPARPAVVKPNAPVGQPPARRRGETPPWSRREPAEENAEEVAARLVPALP